MDFDLSQIRAFVVAVEEGHFGRAAARLFLSQQGLSKRIQRLEQQAGETLFIRHHNRLELTDTGLRLLPHARELLRAADAASDDLRPHAKPIRVDVWGQVHAPMRLVGGIARSNPDLVPQLSMRRSTSGALAALDRGDVDVAFGRPFDLAAPISARVKMEPVCIERLGAAVSLHHQDSAATEMTLEQVRRAGLWWPVGPDGQEELTGFLDEFGDRFGIPVATDGVNLGRDELVSALEADPSRVALYGIDWEIPPDAQLRVIEMRPTPLFLWWVLWLADTHHALVAEFLEQVRESAATEAWPHLNPDRYWLPAADLAAANEHFGR